MSEAALEQSFVREGRERGMDVFYEEHPRVLVLWPHPRSSLIYECLRARDAHEQADAFSYLRENGLGFATIDPFPRPVNPWQGRGSTLSGLDPVRALSVLANYRRFDALVSMDTSSCLFFLMAKRIFGLRKPVVVIDPAMDLNSRVRRSIHAFVLRRVDAVVVFGAVQLRFLESAFGRDAKVSFIRHRIDLEFFDASLVGDSPAREPYILSVGEDSGRDFDTLLEAVADLDVKLVLKTTREFAKPAPPNVTVLKDRMSFEALRELYANATLVVLPLRSTLHASGINTLLEGMAMSKAVIVSGSEGIRDYIENGENAWVVPPEDPAALHGAIMRLLNNPAERTNLGINARKYCEEFCSMRIYMRQVSAIIRGALSAGSHTGFDPRVTHDDAKPGVSMISAGKKAGGTQRTTS